MPLQSQTPLRGSIKPARVRGPHSTPPKTGRQSVGPLPPMRPAPASGGQRTPLKPGNKPHTEPRPTPTSR